MLVLLQLIYVYSGYLWSYIVNRNRSLNEHHENDANCNVFERNTEYGESGDDKEIDSSANADQSEGTDDKSGYYLTNYQHQFQGDNLEIDSSDKFSFTDNFEKFDEAVYDFDTKKLTFFPPVYVQRYITVGNILKDERWRNEIKKVVDIGCAELGFFKFLKHIDGLEKILEIDIDKKLLKDYSYRIQPWVSDYLKDRTGPLEATILCGNVTRPDCHLEGVDAVVAIELIEHLFPPDLEALPFNIFGVIKPRIAIFTTPNEEFNVLFDNFSGFRHYDHKFEWKRREFESWANNICSRYPCYEVNFFGIGPGPKGNDNLGCCSQGCVFIRTSLPVENCFTEPLSNYVEYEVIDHVDYPYRKDSRSQDKITLDDAENFFSVAERIGNYRNGDRIEIPLGVILLRVNKTCKSLDKLKHILEESGYTIEEDKDGDYIVVVPESYFDSNVDSDDSFESNDVSNQFIYCTESGNGHISEDWDNVEQDGVEWITNDTQSNDLKNICSNHEVPQFDDNKLNFDNGDYKSEHFVAPDVDTYTVNGEDRNVSNVNLGSTKSLDDLSLSEPAYNVGIENINPDKNIFQEISQKSVDMYTGSDNPKTTYSTTEESGGHVKHSEKSLSSEDCKSFDISEISRTCLNYSNDSSSVPELEKSVRENFDKEEKEIRSVTCNSKKLISGDIVSEESPVSEIIPGKSSGLFHEVHNSKNLDAINISPLISNLGKNIFNGDYSETDTLSQNVYRRCSNSEEASNHIAGLKNKCDKLFASEVLVNSCQCDNSDLNKKSNLSDYNSISDNRTNEEKTLCCEFNSPPPSSVLDPIKEVVLSFMNIRHSTLLDFDYKSSKTAVNYINGKMSNGLSKPSNSSVSRSDSNNTRMFDELIKSDVSNDKKIPSDLSLCTNGNIKKFIRTHDLMIDKNESLTNSVVAEEHFNSEPNTFNICEENYDRMSKSHSLSHFLQFPSSVQDECNKFVDCCSNSSKDVAFLSTTSSSPPADCQKLTERFGEKIALNENCQEDDYNDEALKDFLHTSMERQDSFSPDKAGDSGYPNSNSGRDMEMDLTPEQVKEIMTEGESSLENSPLDSPAEEAVVAIIPHPPVLHLGDNVENGDVANNNRDGEGNNMIGQADLVGEPLEFRAVIDHLEEVPLMAMAEFIGRNGEIDNEGDNLNNKCSENDSFLEIEKKEINYEAGAKKKEKLHSPMSFCMPNSSCSACIDRVGTIKRSKTFLDEPSTFKPITDKGSSESNSNSCPDSTFKLIDDTKINCVGCSSNLSCSSTTNRESFKMVNSYNIRDLKNYDSLLAERSSMCLPDNCTDFLDTFAERSSVLHSDSVPSCSFSNGTLCVSSIPQMDMPLLVSPLDIPSSISASEGELSFPQVISSMSLQIFDGLLDSVIRGVVEEFVSFNLEPFADMLLQMQLEGIVDEPNVDGNFQNVGDNGLRALDDGNSSDSDQVLTVEADVKGGGDSPVEQ